MNIGTGVAQGYMNQVNQVTPDGSSTWSTTGTHKWTDPISGKTYDLPQRTLTQTLSPAQQAIKDRQDAAKKNLAGLADSQSRRLQGLLDKPFTLDNLPDAADPKSLTAPQYQRFGKGPQLQTTAPMAGPIQNTFADVGDVRRTYGTDFSKDRQRVEDALMQRMAPKLQQDREALEARLASQGIRMGSEAYNAAMDDLSRGANDARMSAILKAGQEQSRLAGLEAQRAGFENTAQQQAYAQALGRGGFANQAQSQRFGQDMQRAQFGNAALQQQHQNAVQRTSGNNQIADQQFRSQQAMMNAQNQARANALNERYRLRNQPINEISALLSGSQVSNPQFVNTPQTQLANTDFAGIQANYDNNRMRAWQTQVQAQQAAQQRRSGLWGGILGATGLIGASMPWKSWLSDRRAKTDIKKVGKSSDGLNIYAYRYKGGGGPMQLGMMAQEVEKKKPRAVTKGPFGLKMVNYELATA